MELEKGKKYRLTTHENKFLGYGEYVDDVCFYFISTKDSNGLEQFVAKQEVGKAIDLNPIIAEHGTNLELVVLDKVHKFVINSKKIRYSFDTIWHEEEENNA